MRRFAYVEPESLQAASRILAREGEGARPIAGGADLLGEMKDGIIEPRTVVDLKSIPGLDRIRLEEDGTVRIGALATLTAVETDDAIRREFPAVGQAAASVASPEIRNVGTVGGNLCQRPRCWYYRSPLHPCLKKGGEVCYTLEGDSRYNAILGGGPSFIVHPSDLAPALVACGARVGISGPAGPRELPLEEFYVLPEVRLDRETILEHGEIVTEVTLPRRWSAAGGARSLFLKFREKDSFDFALVSVAAALTLRDGRCETGRVVLGGVAPIPWRSRRAEAEIEGEALDPITVGRAAEAALAAAAPLAHNGYKVPLAKALIRRALLDLAREAGASSR
ncbi:MAG: FAD binding domain-containing protein [Acidobacteriota bacterium]